MSTAEGGGNIVTDGLIFYLDAANTKSYVNGSTIWDDLSRGENNGELVNGPTFDTSNGGSIVFDGVDDYVNFTSLNPITSNNPFTLSSWLNVKTHTTYGISIYIGNASVGGSAYLGYVSIAQNGTNSSIGGGFYGVNFGSGILPNTGWHFLSLSYDGSNALLYVDSVVRVVRNSFTPSKMIAPPLTEL